MNKAVLFISLALLGLSTLASAEETPLWQVHWGKTIWKASSSKLWISTPSGSKELTISKSNLKYLRDEVSELSMLRANEKQCAAYAEFQSIFGIKKVCEPALNADSKAVTLLSRLKKLK